MRGVGVTFKENATYIQEKSSSKRDQGWEGCLRLPVCQAERRDIRFAKGVSEEGCTVLSYYY